MSDNEGSATPASTFQAVMDSLFLSSFHNWAAIQQSPKRNPWPMYGFRVDEFGLRPFLNEKLGVAFHDTYNDIYFLYLR
jgi:hypothetical protein